MEKIAKLTAAAALALASPVFADDGANWTSVDAESSVAFGSIKSDYIGEVHHFNSVSGSVSEAGALEIEIDVASVETYIDIRNERMVEHIFQALAPTAVINAEIDMADVESLAPGETKLVEIQANLAFGGEENELDAMMLIARLAEDRVLVSTADFIMISTEDLGIEPGIDKLMELADLPSITRATPVSIRMVFEK
ncbi:MAG: YceI family protein [Pseudomonadota bacterium]